MRVSRSAVEVSKKASVGEMDHGVEPCSLQDVLFFLSSFTFHAAPSGYRYGIRSVICNLFSPLRLRTTASSVGGLKSGAFM